MGSLLKPQEQGLDDFHYVRRGRRLSKHRVSHFLFFLAVIFLFCLSALCVNMFLHGKVLTRSPPVNSWVVKDEKLYYLSYLLDQ